MTRDHHGPWLSGYLRDQVTNAKTAVWKSGRDIHSMWITSLNWQTAVKTVKETYRSFVAGCATRPKALIVISPDLRRNAHIEVLLDGKSVVDLDLEAGDDSMGR